MLAFFVTLVELPFVLCTSQPATVKTTRIAPAMTPCLTCGLHDLHQSRNDSQRDFRGVMRGSFIAYTLWLFCSAALRNHCTASGSSFGTPRLPKKKILPNSNW